MDTENNSNEKYVGDVQLFKPDQTTETYLVKDVSFLSLKGSFSGYSVRKTIKE